MELSSMTPAVHAADGISIAVSEFALERRARATARSPAATLIAADPTTRTDPGRPEPSSKDVPASQSEAKSDCLTQRTPTAI